MVTMSHHDGYQLEQNRFLQSSHFCCATSTMAAITVKCVGDRGKNPATTNGGWERSQQAPHSRAARMQHQPLPCNFLFFRFSTCQFRQRSEELLPAPPAERTARAQPTAATRGVAQLRVTREPPAPTSPLPAVPLHARPALSRAGSERTNAATKRGAAEKMLDENNHLIQCIMDYQNKGKTSECSQYQQMLHTNLVYLATIADSNQNMQSLLPAPPTQNMPMGPGGMSQSGPPPPPRSHNMSSDGLVGGGPPAPHMQNQMNGQMPGPMMHQQPPSQQYNMPQAGSQHYQGQQPPMGMMGQVNQGNHMMGQRQIPPYRPPQQGPPQQYSGQEDYYGDQYSHGGQGPPEGMNQQYYPDGHNDYGYQQPSYPEQGYDRPYEDSSQHYYEGGNSQYGQQQDAYQGPPQQQGYPPQQQQYPGQQGYPGQQQGYGPSQGGPGPQYPNYPQGQGQQYGGYRPTQPGPPQPPQQRPYGYDQGQYGNYQQ
uniref:SS18 subunit of BAF chromatin remodeling complex n=1 Tax=Meleagris gallopavo TaxID=9103 RepID=A0A803YCN5_MELGA